MSDYSTREPTLLRQPAAPHDEMTRLIERHTGVDGLHPTAIEPLHLFRQSQPVRLEHALHGAGLCLIAQGAKSVMMGDETFFYDPAHFFLVSLDLPVVSQVTHASPDAPYLGLHLAIDPAQIGALVTEAQLPATHRGAPECGLSVGEADAPLLDAIMRLLRLLDAPTHIPILSPMIVREILYLMLVGNEGANLRRIALAGSDAGVVRALSWLKTHFAAPLVIETLARQCHMSPSSFHHQFKALTAMTPLQYQKRLRLQEARRLMLGEQFDVARAGQCVGYESASQFSREYRRLFGEAPQRDIARLRAEV